MGYVCIVIPIQLNKFFLYASSHRYASTSWGLWRQMEKGHVDIFIYLIRTPFSWGLIVFLFFLLVNSEMEIVREISQLCFSLLIEEKKIGCWESFRKVKINEVCNTLRLGFISNDTKSVGKMHFLELLLNEFCSTFLLGGCIKNTFFVKLLCFISDATLAV